MGIQVENGKISPLTAVAITIRIRTASVAADSARLLHMRAHVFMSFFPRAQSVNNDEAADVVSLHSELDGVPEDVPAVHVRNLCKVRCVLI